MDSKKVVLSQKTQELIEAYLVFQPESATLLQQLVSKPDVTTLLQWLETNDSIGNEGSQKNKEFVLACLRAELLKDLQLTLKDDEDTSSEAEDSPQSNRLKFFLLAAAGTLLAACEGFDSVSTVMEVFALPSAVTLAVGIVFSLVSVLVFYGFNLVQLSKNLGVKLTDAPKLLDIYLEQMGQLG